MSEKDFPVPLQGQCRCGVLTYRITSAPKFSFACHCTDCQQLTSSAFSMGLAVDKASFELKGEPHRWSKVGSSGKESHQFTCPFCTGWTHTETESHPGVVVVRPSTLDDHRWFRPIAQLYTRSAYPWALMPVQFSFETEFEDPAPLAEAFAAGGIRP
ncbi:GFA family protein [Lichenicoccus roseus]|uniref:GFA family protein n=1 Tax=Lichenicoccus roseus TaxID=2683649 RepID=A0A5R9J4H7_9PROT|nr:GFA family protein [Lichenicoccus roseus]TLU71407.1 GFA family protein [Lichenicoccus roseus]